MARRRRVLWQRTLAACSTLPWWVWAALAVGAYFGLHSLATSEVTMIMLSGSLDQLADQTHDQVALSAGQYLLPLVLGVVAALSAYGQHAHPDLHGPMTMTPRQSVLQSMSWQQFVRLVGEAFRRKGYSIVEKGERTSRIDFVLKKSGQTCLVNCKQWRAFRVGVNAVHEMYGVMADKGAQRGIIVTGGVFTDEAMALAKAGPIELIDGKALRALTRGVSVPARVFRDPLSILTRGAPYCPECQGRMVKKRASKGSHAGKAVWRCVRYPDCKGKRPV